MKKINAKTDPRVLDNAQRMPDIRLAGF